MRRYIGIYSAAGQGKPRCRARESASGRQMSATGRATPRLGPRSGRKTQRRCRSGKTCAGKRRQLGQQCRSPVGVQVHGRLVQQQQRGEAPCLGDQRRHGPGRRPISSAFCWPVLARAAAVPVAASASRMSARWAPSVLVPAAASRCARCARAGAQPVLHRQRRVPRPAGRPSGTASTTRARGKRGGRPRRRRSGAHQAARAAEAATAWRAMASSSPASQAAVAAAPARQQAVALPTAASCARHLAGVARLQRPDQAVQEAAAAGRPS